MKSLIFFAVDHFKSCPTYMSESGKLGWDQACPDGILAPTDHDIIIIITAWKVRGNTMAGLQKYFWVYPSKDSDKITSSVLRPYKETCKKWHPSVIVSHSFYRIFRKQCILYAVNGFSWFSKRYFFSLLIVCIFVVDWCSDRLYRPAPEKHVFRAPYNPWPYYCCNAGPSEK